ncbi:Hemicentin-1 [Blattella germanica]|nr:Hemicentin-1 [Blattella germanica]
MLTKKRLHIKNVSVKDNGVYRCSARNEAGSRNSADNFALTVADLDDLTGSSFEPPLPPSKTRIVPEKAEFELTCIPAVGIPPARVWWLDPRGHVVSDSGPVRVDETRLIIEAARAADDTGNYTCVAENMAGTKMASFNLIVSSEYAAL